MIGERVMELLSGVDQVAYVRFASVYREFKDARDFVDEVEPILARDGTAARAGRPGTPPVTPDVAGGEARAGADMAAVRRGVAPST